MSEKKNLRISIGILLILIGFGFGYLVGHQNLKFEGNLQPRVVNTELYKPREVDFGQFWDAWKIIEERYPGEKDTQEMVYGAISGMVAALGDPYSMFMNPESVKRFNEDLKGSFDGIGVEISARDGKLVVVAPLQGSPAEKAGIRAKDQIIKINDHPASEMTFDEAISKIRGKKGTSVKISIYREGQDKELEFTLNREKIEVKSVSLNYEDEWAVIKINQFGEDTTDLLKGSLEQVKDRQSKGIILDLRNNPGGYLDTAIETTSFFLPKDSVVVKQKSKDSLEESKSTGKTILLETPLVILIDKGSASASEIMAGALQDYGRAVLIGETTFGKGSVQTLEPLENNANLRLTTAQWLTPKDRMINSHGIEPDIKVERTEEDINNQKDPQKEKAKEYLKEKISK